MNRFVALQSQDDKRYVSSCSSDRFVRTPQDFLDLLAWGNKHETNLILLEDVNFVAEFYDLSTGLAGEILQKVSNYSARLAIVGTFDIVVSKRFRELMAESNKGSQVRFAHSRNEAITWLTD